MKVVNRDTLGRFIKGFHACLSAEFKRGHIPWIEGKHHNGKTKQRLSMASRGNHHALINPNLEMSETLAYILGVIYGDGYFQFLKGSWKVGLHVSEIEFAKSFREALSQIGLRPSKIMSSPSDYGMKQYYRVEAYSKAFYDFYDSLSLSELKDKLLLSQNLTWAFLRGLYESEGTKLYRGKHSLNVMALYNTNHKLIQLAEVLLNHLGFPYAVVIRKPYGNRKSLYGLALRSSSQRKEEFLRLLNPCIKNA